MKTIFHVNRVLIVILTILFLTIYLGLIFLIPVGAVQVLCAIVILMDWEKLSIKVRRLLTVYLVFTSLILVRILFQGWEDQYTLYILGTSIALAYYFFYITYLCKKEEEIFMNQQPS